jgi:exonuclease III
VDRVATPAVVAGGAGMALALVQHNVGPLDSLNANLCYDLNDKLNLVLGSENDANPYIDFPLNTKFYDLYSFAGSFRGKDNILCLSLNIRSLMCNHNKLSDFLLNLNKNGVEIFAIALQEVWSVPYPELTQIDGFNLILKTRTKSRGGGVGFYVNSKVNFKIRDDLSLFHEKDFECITIETQFNKTKYLLSNIYRSPTSSTNESSSVQIENFNSKLDSFLNDLYNYRSEAFVFLDANINLLKLANSNPANDYISILHSNGFLQLISKATRIHGETYSLIDHILCKSYNPDFRTGTLLLDISDHFLTFLSVPLKTFFL